MRRLPSMILGLLVGGGVFGSLSLLKAQGAPPAAPGNQPQVGRYTISAAQPSGVWCIDTATGDTWYRPPTGQWEKKGNPTTAAKAEEK